MTNVFVLDDNVCLNGLAGRETKRLATERRNRLRAVADAKAEDVDVEIIARLEKLDRLIELFVEAVIVGNCRVARGPPMRSESAVLSLRALSAYSARASCGSLGRL
jgi:hypothetical protein